MFKKRTTKNRKSKSKVYPIKNKEKSEPQKKKIFPKIKKFSLPYRKIGVSVGIVFFLVILITGFYQGYRYVFNSPRFNISKVTVTHTKHLNQSEIIKLANIKSGTNIFKLDLMRVTKNLVRHPWIKEAKVWRELPDIIHIELKEQKVAAVIKFESECSNKECDEYDTFYLINEDGKIFKRASFDEIKGFIVFSGLKKTWFRENPTGFKYLLKRNLAVYKTYSTYKSLPELSEIYSGYNTIVLILKKSAVSVHLAPKRYKESIAEFATFLSGFEMKLIDITDIFVDNEENISRLVVILFKNRAETVQTNKTIQADKPSS